MTVRTEGDGAGRDRRGRFAKGNKASQGHPELRRIHAARVAFRDAVTPVEIQLMAMKLAQLAQAGDTTAARIVLEYVVGKPRVAEPPVAIDLGSLADAQSYARAFATLATAAAAGEVEPSAAVALAALLRQGADATVARDLEERLRAIEERDQREANDA